MISVGAASSRDCRGESHVVAPLRGQALGPAPTFMRCEGRKGFSLLEVMIAMAILATVLVVLLQNHGMSIRVSLRARQASIAANLARDLMTEIELEGFPTVGSETGNFMDRYPGLYPGYTWEREVNESVFADYIREVTVRVNYPVDRSTAGIELLNLIGAKDIEEQEMAGLGGGEMSGKSPGEQALMSSMGRMSEGGGDKK